MDPKAIISLVFILIGVSALMPVVMEEYSRSRDVATNESEQLDYYNSLSDADKANYTSDYAEDGEPPTPLSKAELSIFGIIGIIIVIAVMRGIKD